MNLDSASHLAMDGKTALEAKAVFVPCELAKLDEVRKIMAVCESSFGRVDALVNAPA